MKHEALLRDPVFQLNLLIWMVKEQPSTGYRVRPFFFEKGFRLVYIEQPFAFPDPIARAIEASSLSISKAPEPEMILGRDADQKALYFEAKANAFKAGDDYSKQARGHILACGPAFAETLKPLQHALLCYVVPKYGCTQMEDCLVALTTELVSAAFVTGEHSIQALAVSGHELIYSWDTKFKEYCSTELDSIVVFHELREDTDPSPLLLIFTDEDCPTSERAGFYRKVLINQVVAKLVSDLNLLLVDQAYAVTARELLSQTTDGTMNYLGRERQKSMIRIVRQNLFARISTFWREKQFSPVKLENDRLEIRFKDNLAKAEFLDWLEDGKRTNFSDEKVDEKQMLFSLPETSAVSGNNQTTPN